MNIAHTHRKNSFFAYMLKILSHKKIRSSHVRMSNKAQLIFNDKELTKKLVDAILEKKDKLEEGKEIEVQDSNITIELVSNKAEDVLNTAE